MGMLQVNWFTFAATAVNLIVLYQLMRHFLFQPIQNVLDKRKERIDSEFNQAKEDKMEANQLKDQYERLMEHAKEESVQIVERAKTKAKSEYDNKLELAKSQADKMLETAREKIETEREKMLRELKSQISYLTMSAAAKVIGRNASPKYDEGLYNQFFHEAGETNDTDRS